jgi:hypothetical protein
MLDPKRRLVLNTSQAIRALGISSSTFYIWVKRLGLKPRKKRGTNERFWPYDDLLRIMNAVYKPTRLLKEYLG